MKLIKEIKSKEGELHFKRWQILSTPWFSIYIHGIYKADEDEHLHDHPWNYFSFILWGYFTEISAMPYGNDQPKETLMHPFSFVKRKAETFHKIKKLHSTSIYTLFIIGKRKRNWGYSYKGGWIENSEYRKLKNEGNLSR